MQRQLVWVTWGCHVDGGYVEFGDEHQLGEVVESSYRCASCGREDLDEEAIVTASVA